MRTSKDFLEQERSNLESVLEQTLRFKYGLRGSEFFTECSARLTFLKGEIANAAENDYDRLQNASSLLLQLTAIISRIERSSIGGYSWPFVEELKRIAIALCTEPTLTNPRTPPQIYVLSGGGLDAYEIQPELNRPSGSSKRIHTIVFPRTLKHFVLLHAILGHEVGHAMWRCSQHQKSLNDILTRHLFNAGTFSSAAATAAWLYSPNAPAQVRATLAQLAPRGINQNNFFAGVASWQAWIEEILCDFIGLTTFGPSFVAAESNLLYAMNLVGAVPGPQHPPVGCRINYLVKAAKVCGYASEAFRDADTKSKVTAFWSHLETKRKTDPWFDVFTDQQIQETAEAISKIMATLPPSQYVPPSEKDLQLLLQQLHHGIPPVGFELTKDLKVNCRSIDFRHVLYAGWITSVSPTTDLSFERINRLCEHGIMQQHAVNLQITP